MFLSTARVWRFLGAALLALAAVPGAAAATGASLASGAAGVTGVAGVAVVQGRLVSAAWLQQQLARTGVPAGQGLRVLDASPQQQHRAGHIPGSVSADLMVFGMRAASTAAVEKRLRDWGIHQGQRIVIVDQGGTYMAPRLFWELAHHGVPAEDLFILDGGMAQWRAVGGAVVADATPRPAAGSITLTAPLPDLRVELPAFLAATADPHQHVMLEALDPVYYYGGAGFFNRKGHVPHATLSPADDYFNADKTFKSPADIQRMLDHLGVRREQQVHTYCGGGGAAAVPFFALKYLAGYPRVTLFLESQLAWLQDPRELPVWTYGAPHLLRDGDWLKAWASPMSRMFNLAQVSVLDVRSPDSYRQGHVPLAVNVPASAFRDHVQAARRTARPSALPGLLAQAGVRATDEAVVVSDGGLNGDAALALLVLESLGQQRSSIFPDSLERWADQGRDVVRPKPAGAAAAAAPPSARAAAPGPYAPRPREGLLLADAAPAPGPYARVYIASGAQPATMPADAPAARKQVHLPFTQLLKPDGTPKAAHEIWAVLEKSGVPRFAEIVLFADDVGDAAINYVVLRLMGFADVKVWLR